MKNILITFSVAAGGFVSIPSIANNWHRQLDQIKANRQRRAACAEIEKVQALTERIAKEKKNMVEPEAKAVPAPEAK